MFSYIVNALIILVGFVGALIQIQKHRFRAYIFIAIAVVASGVGVWNFIRVTNSNLASISGKVWIETIDSSGKQKIQLVRGAEVSTHPETEVVSTNEYGEYLISNVPGGQNVSVIASKGDVQGCAGVFVPRRHRRVRAEIKLSAPTE